MSALYPITLLTSSLLTLLAVLCSVRVERAARDEEARRLLEQEDYEGAYVATGRPLRRPWLLLAAFLASLAACTLGLFELARLGGL